VAADGGAGSAVDAVERALRVVADREPVVRAWAHLSPDRARGEAREVDARAASAGAGGPPLRGWVLGVKDVFDTADQPTECGTPIYAGRRPGADAAAVVLLRQAGAVCLGKTVTAELAFFSPGPTTNPHRPTHTPGGSSMGSAAAVATGMADIALGTQTAGSVIRPASFCGVYGFKPTFGSVPVAGVKLVAPSLDTVGWFAREPAALDRVRVALTGRPAAAALACAPVIGVLRTDEWHLCAPESRRAVRRLADAARAHGARVIEVPVPDFLDGLAAQQPTVMAYEAARTLAWERRAHGDRLSDGLREILDRGHATDPAEYDRVQARRRQATACLDELFDTADALLTPAVVGEAPAGLTTTGDPRFARLWTMLGTPSAAVPVGTGPTGLPVGAQLVGRAGDDGRLLAVLAWLAGEGIVAEPPLA
jgi:Asp-tRNA(Asn)/Glu-tRNA(Gln) amidotransferase A subunit family amidase